MLTKREKAWFFPLCGYQPKINELIFRFVFLTTHCRILSASGLSSVSGSRLGAFKLFSLTVMRKPGSGRRYPALYL
ncbi:hypothetical protein F3J29_00310 [Enterobacter sp. Cy-643]|nr:hypothetical protein [Enterobacter sp. Cy-643]